VSDYICSAYRAITVDKSSTSTPAFLKLPSTPKDLLAQICIETKKESAQKINLFFDIY
jgi:hypothetical protein